MWNVGIIGATGYTGIVLISSLLSHSDAKITLITSNTYKEKRFQMFSCLARYFEMSLSLQTEKHAGKCDVYFLCLHGNSMERRRNYMTGSCYYRFERRFPI
jgi:N-acetyl-gamma-glutamyl-phosphate reductase